jgi:hypothetical protein
MTIGEEKVWISVKALIDMGAGLSCCGFGGGWLRRGMRERPISYGLSRICVIWIFKFLLRGVTIKATAGRLARKWGAYLLVYFEKCPSNSDYVKRSAAAASVASAPLPSTECMNSACGGGLCPESKKLYPGDRRLFYKCDRRRSRRKRGLGCPLAALRAWPHSQYANIRVALHP